MLSMPNQISNAVAQHIHLAALRADQLEADNANGLSGELSRECVSERARFGACRVFLFVGFVWSLRLTLVYAFAFGPL